MPEPRWTRRECLRRGAGAVVAAGAASLAGFLLHEPAGAGRRSDEADGPHGLKDYFAAVDYPDALPRLSVAGMPPGARGPGLCQNLLNAALKGLDPQRGLGRFIDPGDVVLIKPNVGFDRPAYLGATANPDLVGALVRLSLEAGAREVWVTDFPIETPQGCFARSGIRTAVENAGGKVLLPTPRRFRSVILREQADRDRREVLQRWPILYEPLAKATKLIGVAPVKDHNLASASITLKNWYGLLGGRRNQFHQVIHDLISDLAVLVKPTLVIADGTRVMLRHGPTGGRPSDVQPGGVLQRPVIVAAVDPVACDAWCYENLLGRDPAALPYLALAEEKIRAAGGRRFGRRDWRVYERQGRIARTGL